MTHHLNTLNRGLIAVLGALLLAITAPVSAEDRTALDRDAMSAVAKLMETTPAAKEIAKSAKAILVFPNIVKAGFIVGAQYGDGALVKGKPGNYYVTNHYNIAAASYGLQAGVQSFGYALMLVTDTAVRHVETSQGWELGVGPSVVVVDEGVARTMSTKTLKDDIYAFTFGQKGLMAGLGLQGTKVTKLQD